MGQLGKRVPNFLIVGAMKSGTTTLWAELGENPEIYFPEIKEPGNLRSDYIFSKAGLQDYSRLFVNAKGHQLCGEASTYYTMLPEIKGVPDRAAQICGRDLKIIYIVRDPIRRIISHHHHAFIDGDMPADINDAVLKDDRLINYSRYAMQLEPWLKVFGPENICILTFEDFITQRAITLNQLCRFLGLKAGCTVHKDSEALNAKEDLVRLGLFGKFVSRSTIYRRMVRPLISQDFRKKAMKKLGKDIPQGYSSRFSHRTLRFILGAVSEDCLRLSETLHVPPRWDLEATASELSP